MGCGASSQVKGPAHAQVGAAESTTTPDGRESQAPRKADSKPHQEEEEKVMADQSPEKSSLMPAPAQGQAVSAPTASQGDAQESSTPHTHAHQVPDTGASPSSSTQPTAHDDSSSGHDGSCAATGTSSPDLLEKLRSQMRAGFQRRNEQFAQDVFNKHKSPSGLSKASLGQALSDLGIKCASGSDVDELFYTLDVNSDGWISWSEFLMVLSKPSKIQQWASTLPLAPLLADCMPSKDDEDPVRALSELSLLDIQAVSACFSEGLVQLLRSVCLCVCVCVTLCMCVCVCVRVCVCV